MSQQQVYNLLKENNYLKISQFRTLNNKGGKDSSINSSLNRMIKFNEVVGFSVNEGEGHRVIFYSLIENKKQVLKELTKLYKSYGEIKEFIPLHKNKKTKGGYLGRLTIK